MSFFKKHAFFMGALVLAVAIAAGATANVAKRNNKTSNNDQTVAGVKLVSAGDYLNGKSEITANGTVESLEQADLRSQVSAPVTGIKVAIGSEVRQGQELIILQNSDFAAQLAQAQAGLKAQEARLDEMKKGLRDEEYNVLEAKLQAAKQTLEDTKTQSDLQVSTARKNMLNAGLAASQGIGNTAAFTATLSGSYNGNEEGKYNISIQITGAGANFVYSGLESGSSKVSTLPQPLGTKGLYIKFSDTAAGSYSNYNWIVNIPNTESSMYLTARNAYDAAVQGRETAINSAQSMVTATEKEFDLRKAGASNEQIKAQEAAVDQARASVMATGAQLSKTIIRTPINGTVSAINVKYGELVSPGQAVVSIVNKAGMQVKAYISEADMTRVEEGADATIDGKIAGKVARLSPSVNQQTKAVEVNVIVANPEESGLVVGQNASVSIGTKSGTAARQSFLLPLQAVKITNQGAFVYMVGEDSTLVEKQVALGTVSGENVEVVEGLQPENKIVSTTYDLKPGQKVNAQ